MNIKLKNKKGAIGIILAIIIAGAVLVALLKPTPAEAVTVKPYGEINYRMGADDNAAGNSVVKATDNGSKAGVKIQTTQEGIRGFARVEVGVNSDDTGSNPFKSRVAFAGVDMGDMGSVSAGRQNSVFKGAVTSKTDVFPEYGNKAVQKLFSRDSHTVVYANKFAGMKFNTLVKVDGATGKSGTDVLESTVTFDVGPANVGLGMSNDKVNDVDYTGVGVSLPLSVDTALAYNYTKKDTTTDVEANDIVVTHVIGDTKFAVGYGKIKDGNAYTTLGATKSLTKNFQFYAGFENADIKDGQDTSGLSAGLKMKF